ncbi:glutathione-disulfide reductase [Henriciella mobilis]|uniref:glutathione-disulfide reductase n=1 Tax=Henriciella mobilis TaxID=2305467 RepID=UPI000E665DF6|nr:glutathione-disulfide reductase [Henriciella mobilis]RIJ15511.1 glutathione-disulfide reductase [Henriciella mobilis]RIJ18975.1 glutathione-disulfide reductase [Henriciella mobilis]
MADLGYDYDLFVIGAGSGGVRAARIAAQSGAKVAIAEEYRIGGTCVIRGCVPKKFMVYASDYGRKVEEARNYGWDVEMKGFDFPKFMSNLHAEVDRLSGIYLRNLANAGVDVFEERAEMKDANTVVLKESGKTFTVDKILIATGGAPWRPSPEDLPGVEHTITSNEIFHLEKLPRHIVIAGGGYIACEFAHVFAGLGVETCLVYRGDTVLNGFDWDVRTAVHEGLKEAGVRVITQTVFDRIEKTDGECPYEVHLTNDTRLKADVVMMAVGRRAATDGLGCDAAGVKLDEKGSVIVDDASRTSVPNIFAVGDVTDRIQLTPVAIREGHAFADTVFGDKDWSFEHDNVASGVFTQPEVGTVGMTEAEARKAFKHVDIYKTQFRPMKVAMLERKERVLMKLVVKADDQRVVGVHIVSPEAAEMIQMIAIAVKMGVTKQQFDATCAVHPTIAEEIVTMRQKWVPETEPA